MRVLNDREIDGLLAPPEILAAVEEALKAMDEGSCTVPQRMHAQWNGNTFLAMPSFAAQRFGTKLVSVVPQNAARDLPVTNGVMILNDAHTGIPLALLNAARLTALRTGAVGATAIRLMTPPGVADLGIIGCGAQGLQQALFACAVRPITTVYCLDRSSLHTESFAAEMGTRRPGVSIVRSPSAEHLLEHSSVVITATTSASPVLPDDPARLRGKHLFGIGSYRPSMQELPDAAFALAGTLVIDTEHASRETGDIINPLQKGLLREQDVFTLGALLLGRRRVDVSGTTVFKSAGMALFDLFVAAALVRAAEERNTGHHIAL
jgi:ornithine cyclodeaminase/alanine dehydrogenase-like protein (mu-crystallin family)